MSKDRAQTSKEVQELVQAFLDKGGKITKCDFNVRTNPDEIKNSWGQKKAAPKKAS